MIDPAAFSDPQRSAMLLGQIRQIAARLPGPVRLMEVCGTHTMEIGRLGLRSLLPANVTLISGPGCPVCVTPGAVIDAAAECSLRPNVSVLTFGDMLRVPGDRTSLEEAHARGGSVEVVTTPLQLLEMARNNPSRHHVFVAVGFETTIPSIARTVQLVVQAGLENCSFLICHRIVPPALHVLCSDPAIGISGFLLPGHVSAIIGEAPYHLLDACRLPGAITGFEPLDILWGIRSVLAMIADGTPAVVNMYPRVVRPQGNPRAMALIDEIFEPVDALWRGIGVIPASGLALRSRFRHLDAQERFNLDLNTTAMPAGCQCGSVLRGVIAPPQCPLFGSACTPRTPVGPCMVSSEGSCAAWHRYEDCLP